MNAIRGTTLVETAIMLAISLMLLLGIVQLEMIGWSQASAQGAAFVAAHAVSVHPQGTTAADQAYAQAVIANAFPDVLPGQLTLSHPTGASVQVIVSKNPGGLLMIPGSSALVNVQGVDIEPMFLALTPPPPSPYGVVATLKNYCTASGACNPAHPLYITQYDDLNGKGNGSNGQFGEWKCRPSLFYNFPKTMPSPSGAYDPASSSFVEKNLYSFDSQSALWGVQASC